MGERVSQDETVCVLGQAEEKGSWKALEVSKPDLWGRDTNPQVLLGAPMPLQQDP